VWQRFAGSRFFSKKIGHGPFLDESDEEDAMNDGPYNNDDTYEDLNCWFLRRNNVT
jgi:hypothetical protein